MPEQTLAQKIKAKYPGQYDDLSDQDLEAKITAKYSGVYDDIPKTTGGTDNPMNFAVVNGQKVPVEGSPTERFVEGAAKYLNPVTAVEGMASAVRHPLDTAKAQWDALEQQRNMASELAKQGRYSEAIGHFVAGMLPFLGPPAAAAGERIGSGDIAGGVGEAVGLLAPAALPLAKSAVGATVNAAKGIPGAAGVLNAAADVADQAANTRAAQVIAPTVGANKVRLGNMAAEVAPAVARETTGLTRAAIARSISGKLEDAAAGLDAASDARLEARSLPTRPVLDALQAARDRLTAKAVEASEFKPQSGVNRPPVGEDVVPGPNAARVAQIDQAMQEIRKLGPVARYESLRRIRESYDAPAKAVYSPAVTADFLKAQGGQRGAADVTGAIRGYLAKMDPGTATANADYSLWKSADTVIQAAEEVDRVRPTVGRTIMSRGLGAAVGASEDGPLGAAVGATLGPLLERAGSGLSPAIKITVARNLASLADALRAGQVTRATGLLQSLRAIAASGKAKALVSGNSLGTMPQPALGAQP